jgi:hypothetical protein
MGFYSLDLLAWAAPAAGVPPTFQDWVWLAEVCAMATGTVPLDGLRGPGTPAVSRQREPAHVWMPVANTSGMLFRWLDEWYHIGHIAASAGDLMSKCESHYSPSPGRRVYIFTYWDIIIFGSVTMMGCKLETFGTWSITLTERKCASTVWALWVLRVGVLDYRDIDLWGG